MDIKSRNIRYSIWMKAAAVFLIWVSLAGVFASLLYYGRYYGTIEKSSYNQTQNFSYFFDKCVERAIYSNAIPILTDEVNGLTAGKVQFSNKELSNFINFRYMARNLNTGAIVSNFSFGDKSIEEVKNDLLKNESQIYYSTGTYSVSPNLASNYISAVTKLKNTPVELVAAVADSLVPGDDFYILLKNYEKVHGQLTLFLIIVGTSFILGVSCFVYLVMTAGRSEKKGIVTPALVDWFYNDIHTILVLCAASLSVQIARGLVSSDNWVNLVSVFILASLDLMIGVSYVLSMVRHSRRGTLFSHTLAGSLIRVFIRVFKQSFSGKTFKPVILVMLLSYSAINSILFATAIHAGGNGFQLLAVFLLVFNIAVIYFTLKALASLSSIMTWVKELTKGNLDQTLSEDHLSPVFAVFASDIKNLQTGIRHAISEAVKGERLKTELITNVSHDLKTPLTSIINYVDLLKKESPDNETINEYIGVLEDKSARLKKLIEDLIEASKAASGDMPLNLGDMDLCSLVGQAVAEYNEKIQDCGLDVRVKPCENPVMVRADGTLVWRIMDNLLSNIVKYSQKNSRVYIDMEQKESYGSIIVKNISEMPLDISADQLLERFVRGDSSRSTEGSGLGLSIAKSLAEMQGGKLDLSIDGDLFKVIVELPSST